MLNCYTRYIIRHLAGPTIFITLTLTGVAWLSQSLRFIDMIVNKGVSVSTFLYLTVLLMPSLLGIVLPIALFCSVLYAYNKLTSDSELIALENAGLSTFALARPALITAACVTMLGYAISLYLLPTSYREFKDLQQFIRDNYASLFLEEGIFNTPMQGLTVYIREKEPNGILRGVLAHDNSVPEKPVTYMAEEGQLVQTPSGPGVILVQGNRQEVDHANGNLALLHFDRYTLDLSHYIKESETRWREPEERYLSELFFPGPDHPELHAKLHTEGHQRLVWPLYTPLLTLVGLSALLSGQFNRRGHVRRIVIASIAAVLVIALGIGMPHIVTKNPSLTPLMYLSVLVVAFAASVMMGKRAFRRQSTAQPFLTMENA